MRGVRGLVPRLAVPLTAVAMLAGCAGVTDPVSEQVREKSNHAAVGLEARLTPLMRQHEVVADWQADYCVDDPLTVADWDCHFSRNVALHVDDLRAGAEAVDAELTRLGCHPEGDRSRMGLGVMLDGHDEHEPAHRLPAVRFRCGQDDIHVQPSDSTDVRHTIVQRPPAWPEQATGGTTSRLLGGGVLSPEDGERLRSQDGALLLVTAVRPYHSE